MFVCLIFFGYGHFVANFVFGRNAKLLIRLERKNERSLIVNGLKYQVNLFVMKKAMAGRDIWI